MQLLTNLDLNKNELQNARMQNLGAVPINPGIGQIYFSTIDGTFYGWTGAIWKDLGQVLTGESIITLINGSSSTINDDNLSANVADAIAKRHSHSNMTVLNAMEVAFTNALKTKIDGISTGATKTEQSSTNGNIKIDGVEKTVYIHPGSGTNPHGTTKSDVGLGNVDNKSSATIRGEITSTNVTTALGFTPVKDGGSTPELRGGLESARPAATGSGMVYFATDTQKIYKDTALSTWTQMGGQDIPIATSTILGLIKVGANLTIGADGTLNANDNPASFIIKHERFTITGGQTSFTLTKGTYKPNTKTIFWYLDGFKQDSDALIESSNTTFGVPAGLPDGVEILVEYFETINANPFPNHAAEHLSTGADPIPDATTTQGGLMSAPDKSKLAGIEAGAQVNTVTSVAGKTGAVTLVGTDIPAATTSARGTVQLSTSTTSTSTTTAATPSAVKAAMDKANAAETPAGAQTKADTAEANAKAYADTKVAALVNSSPSTLDTLKELADALGDDPNFATTITNQIALKTNKYAVSIGDGSTATFTINHGLNTMDITVLIRENVSPYNQVITDMQIMDVNNIKLLFATAPTATQYRVVVTG